MMLDQIELKRLGSTFDALSSINSNKSKIKVFAIKPNKLFYYRVTLGLKTAISFHFLCPWWLSLHWQAWGCNGSCVFYAGNICWYVAFVSRPIPFGIPSSQFPVPSSQFPVPPSVSFPRRLFVIAQTSPLWAAASLRGKSENVDGGMGIFSRLNLSACVLFVPLSNGFIIRMTANPDPVTRVWLIGRMGDSMYILYVGPIPQSHTQVAGGLANDSKWQVIESFKCAISQRTATKIRWL